MTCINSATRDTDLLRIGKPKALKHDVAGYWSRRTTDEHRLAYKLVDEIRIATCHYHYHYGR